METAKWDTLGLSPSVMSVITDLGFTHVTPVQASCIPLFLNEKRDVAVEAITGSGKTLAFLVPVFEMMLKKSPIAKNSVIVIIISPTRELATQTSEIINAFLKHHPQFTSALLIGGRRVKDDIERLLNIGANIITATPGRLMDLLLRNNEVQLATRVKALEMLVFDEADRLLDMGFEPTINTILHHLPKQRQTGLFSATQTDSIQDLIRAGLRNPVSITVKEKGEQKVPSTLSNFFMICEAEKKVNTLYWFLTSKKEGKFIVFFSTCASVKYFAFILKELITHMPVTSIHGKMRHVRGQIFKNFKEMESGVMLCTDVMARGVDIPDVTWVVQFDPPSDASSFVHRCGRTARIGKTGNALVMLLPNEEAYVDFLYVNQKVTLEEIPAPAEVEDIGPQIKNIAMNDRAVYESGMKALLSFSRFYQGHECNLIFQMKDLPMGKLANAYALLDLPKMQNKHAKKMIENMKPDFKPADVCFDDIAYADKDKEMLRQKKLTIQNEKKQNPEKYKSKPSKKRRQKMRKQKEDAMKRQRMASEQDLDELERDARLLKKFKKGKISSEEFDAQFVPELNM